jgi:hypothetical protein
MSLLDEALVSLYFKQVITGETVFVSCNDRQEIEQLMGNIKLKK